MSSDERINAIGMRAELKAKSQRLEYEITVNRDAIRGILSPLKDPQDIDQNALLSLTSSLAAQVIEYKEILAKLEKIKDILGH